MKEKLTLIARTEYHIGYPPKGAKKAYVAKITGRQTGPTKYCREFLGDSVDLLADDVGLYEVQHALNKCVELLRGLSIDDRRVALEQIAKGLRNGTS